MQMQIITLQIRRKEVLIVEKVKNAADKLVCQIDKQQKLVEIVHKGYTTTIRFFDDGHVEINNTANKVA